MKIKLFTTTLSLLMAFMLLTACEDGWVEGGTAAGGKHTVRLTLSVTPVSIPETKAVVQRARPGSEAEAAGFSYELVSSDTDTTATPVLTKAPATLKNVYALLFKSDGSFNGRANLKTVISSAETTIVFENVTTPDAAGCRLVIVANDNTATNSYSSSGGTGGFDSFSRTYAQFQALTITNTISSEADIPYAGSVTVNLSDINNGSSAAQVPLYRTLAKVTLSNSFSISGGPVRNSITLYNVGTRRFATAGSDNYDGTGSTVTSGVASAGGSNIDNNTWYVGENIQLPNSSVTSAEGRNSKNAPANACYIRIASATQSIAANTNPAIGEEYITSGSRSFTYDIYLGKKGAHSDFSLRRHTNYTISSSVSGTLARQEALAASDGRVTMSKSGGVAAGLNIGKFGGASYTNASSAPDVTGSYTKYLLLEPNATRTTAVDNITKSWSANTSTQLQSGTRKYWDPTYTLNNIDKASGLAYDYCYNLTLGGVPAGTWYLPTQTQLMAIWAIGFKGNANFANYSAFNAYYYWSSTENNAINAWYVNFYSGYVDNSSKTSTFFVRCVRDLS